MKINILEVKNRTSLRSMRKKAKNELKGYYPELGPDRYKLFRKGMIGDWKNHMSSYNGERIDAVENGEISIMTKVIYYFLFTLRRQLNIL